jgi:hypothetical protein
VNVHVLDNIFNNLPSLLKPKVLALDKEFTQYFAAPSKSMVNPLHWWFENQAIYPHLSAITSMFLVSN